MSTHAKAPAAAAPSPTDAPWVVEAPDDQTAPLVFASPHSGDRYPESFIGAARLDPVALRRSEDAFVDELYRDAPACGAPLLKATFPRAFVDPNREAYELDPLMFSEPLPDYANTLSPRVAAGLGTVAKVVTNGETIYRAHLSVQEVLERIERYYRPYHTKLAELISATQERFGACLLIDCHSMPSIGGPMDADSGNRRVDFVLGDRHGASCDAAVTDLAEQTLRSMGYVVTRNMPYAGGYTTRHYGRPENGVHALQIEVNRGIYMDEDTVSRRPGLTRLRRDIARLIATLVTIDAKQLATPSNSAADED